jgi:hypothetical protein
VAKNILSGGVDFDDLFDPDIVGDGPAATWITSAGVALKYAALSYGSKRADVGWRNSAGVDVTNLWAAKGTAVYNIAGLHGKNLNASDAALTSQPNVSATVQVNINNNGTWSVTGGNSKGSVAQPAPTSGTWLPAGASVADFQVQFVVSNVGGTVTNGAAAYAACSTSRGVSHALPTISANNSTERQANATITINLKRISTGSVSTTTVTTDLFTAGYL